MTPRPDGLDRWVRIAPVEHLPDNQSVCLDVDGERIALFHVDGELLAVDDECRHMGGPLSEGCVEAGTVTCPWHRWRYSLRSGQRVDRRGSAVRTHPVRVEDGWIVLGPAGQRLNSL